MNFDSEYAVDLIKETYSTAVKKLSTKFPPRVMEQYLEIRSEWLATESASKAAELVVVEPIQVKELVDDLLRRHQDT